MTKVILHANDGRSGQPPLAATIVFDVAKIDALAFADAEIEFLDVGIFTQLGCAAVEHDATIF